MYFKSIVAAIQILTNFNRVERTLAKTQKIKAKPASFTIHYVFQCY